MQTRAALLAAVTAGALLAGAVPVAAQQPCDGGYVVRTGDTLAEIASRCGTTVPALLSVNPGVRDQLDLQVGGTIRVPPPGTTPSPVEACGGFYTIRSGDSLAEIAEKCGLTVPLLVAANPALENPRAVRPGGRVRIPDLPRPGTAFEPVIVGEGAAAIIAPSPALAPDSAAAAAADSAAAAAADTAAEPVPFVRYEGVLRAGEQCTILRTDDGEEVGIVGGLGPGFEVGERVAVTGPADDEADCGTERAVRVRIMWRPR